MRVSDTEVVTLIPSSVDDDGDAFDDAFVTRAREAAKAAMARDDSRVLPRLARASRVSRALRVRAAARASPRPTTSARRITRPVNNKHARGSWRWSILVYIPISRGVARMRQELGNPAIRSLSDGDGAEKERRAPPPPAR